VGSGAELHRTLNVNDLGCADLHTLIHLLYMRLLDGCTGDLGSRDKGIGLGIVGVGLGPEDEEQVEGEDGRSAHSDSTTMSSRSTPLDSVTFQSKKEGVPRPQSFTWRIVISFSKVI
jgi:hypothetical protein